MPETQQLTDRLQAIADRLASSGQAHALLGLGSAGLEQNRMDRYSDLDFFVIAHPGCKARFIDRLDWLSDLAEPGFYFRNTSDGYKYLYADGVFCEFAVFETAELHSIPFSEGKVVWAEADFDTRLLQPTSNQGHYQRTDNTEWLLGEALTNLYVGLGRYCRGEKLSAMKFVQSYALDRVIDLLHQQSDARTGQVDPFMPDRRLEAHFDQAEELMATFCQGYRKTPESALAQLHWLETQVTVNTVMASEIRRLATEATARS